MTVKAIRRHGLGATKRRAIVVLFQSGFPIRSLAQLFAVTQDEVTRELRKAIRRR